MELLEESLLYELLLSLELVEPEVILEEALCTVVLAVPG